VRIATRSSVRIPLRRGGQPRPSPAPALVAVADHVADRGDVVGVDAAREDLVAFPALVLLKGQEEAAALDAEVGGRVDLMREELVCHHVLLSPAAGSSNRAPDAPTETRFTGTRSPAHGVVMSHTRKWRDTKHA